MINLDVNPTSANFPGFSYLDSIEKIYQGISEPKIKSITPRHMQLCPQNRGHLSPVFCSLIIEKYKNTRFRIHANARVHPELEMFDASYDFKNPRIVKYIRSLKLVCDTLKSPIYSFHAGRRSNSYNEVITNTLNLQDTLKIPVALEGLYPSKKDNWHLSTLKEYESLLNSDIHYAIDLSHMQIVCYQEKVTPVDLIKALVEHKNCLEVHISNNNFYADQHQILETDRFWFDILNFATFNKNTHIFTEGDHRKKNEGEVGQKYNYNKKRI